MASPVSKSVSKFIPFGARVLVEDVQTTLSLEERARRAGIEVVIEDRHRPRVTQGIVIALGSDPLVKEMLKEGDQVFFGPHAGSHVTLEGVEYRQLELQEITGKLTQP